MIALSDCSCKDGGKFNRISSLSISVAFSLSLSVSLSLSLSLSLCLSLSLSLSLPLTEWILFTLYDSNRFDFSTALMSHALRSPDFDIRRRGCSITSNSDCAHQPVRFPVCHGHIHRLKQECISGYPSLDRMRGCSGTAALTTACGPRLQPQRPILGAIAKLTSRV